MHVRVAVLLQQLLLIDAEDVHAVGVECQEQVVGQVGQQVRDALNLKAVKEVAAVHGPVSALLHEQDLQLLRTPTKETRTRKWVGARPHGNHFFVLYCAAYFYDVARQDFNKKCLVGELKDSSAAVFFFADA